MSQLHQMNLEVKLDDQATFDNFYAPKGSTQQLAKFLLQESGQQFVCLAVSYTHLRAHETDS